MRGPDEFDPRVSLDIELKDELDLRDGDIVEIDYHNLRRTLNGLRAPMDNSDLTVVFTAQQHTGPVGEYLPGSDKTDEVIPSAKHTARVEVDPDDLDGTQHILVHELKHYSDHVKGHRSMRKKPAYDKLYDMSPGSTHNTLGAATALVGTPIMLHAATILGASSYMGQQSYDRLTSVLDIALATNATLAIGIVALNCVYVFDESERRARKAARESTVPNVLSVESVDDANQ